MKTQNANDYIIFGSNTFSNKTIELAKEFGQNVLIDNSEDPSLNINILPERCNKVYISAHGDINQSGKHETDLLESEVTTAKAIQQIQQKTSANTIIIASCQGAQIVHDLTDENIQLNDNTKILIIGSKKHTSFTEDNHLILKNIKEASDQGSDLESTFSLLTRFSGQTFQYGEFSRSQGHQFVKRNSKENSQGLEFRSNCSDDFKTKISAAYNHIEADDENRANSAFLEAVDRGNEDRALHWLKNGADINKATDLSGGKSLERAIAKNNLPMLNFLLENGADIEQEGYNGEKPLHNAIDMENSEICQILVDLGANIYSKNYLGISALDCARNSTNNEIIQIFRDKQTDPYSQYSANEEMDDLLEDLNECLGDLELLADDFERKPSHTLQQSKAREVFPAQKQKGLE